MALLSEFVQGDNLSRFLIHQRTDQEMIGRIQVLFLALVVGCGGTSEEDATDQPPANTQQQSPPKTAIGGVGIVDLDDVLEQLKLKKPFERLVLDRKAQSQKQLADMFKKFHSEYEEKKKELGSEPTKEETTELQKFFNEGHQAYSKKLAELDKELATMNAVFVRNVREKAMTASRTIAIKKGLTMVMTKDDVHHLWHAPEVDITDEVAEALQDQRESLKYRP